MSIATPIHGATGTTVGALSVTAPVLRADVARFSSLLFMVSNGITKSITLSMRDPNAAGADNRRLGRRVPINRPRGGPTTAPGPGRAGVQTRNFSPGGAAGEPAR